MDGTRLTEALGLEIAAGRVEACIDLVADLDPAARRALAPFAREELRRLSDEMLAAVATPGERAARHISARAAARMAFLGTATRSEVDKLGWRAVPERDHALALFRRYRPDWLDSWCADLLADQPVRFRLVHALVHAGLVAKPAGDAWILGLMGITRSPLVDRNGSVLENLEAFPQLLDQDVWRLFEVEGGGEFSLAAMDKYCKVEAGWEHTLATFAAGGRLDRGRLLDSALASLGRDFAAFRAGWHSRFVLRLAPTPAEAAARLPVFLRLLGSTIPATVSLAAGILDDLQARGQLPADALLDSIGPALEAKAKGTVKTALVLAGRAAAAGPEAAAKACRVALRALAQGSPEVQKAVLAILQAHGTRDDPELRAELAGTEGFLAASTRKSFSPWLENPIEPSRPSPPRPEPEAPATLEPAALAPLGTLDALLDRFAFVLEHPEDADAVEVVLDAASRLADRRFEDHPRRLGPLAKRAAKLHAKGPGDPHLFDLARLALAWAGKPEPAPPPPRSDTGAPALFRARVDAIAARLAAQAPAPLRSAPTHAGGWIDPAALVERFRAPGAGEPLDTCLALLRLAPWGRVEALAAAKGLEGQDGAALRHALGGPPQPIGADPDLWIAACRARDGGADHPDLEARHPGLGPDAGRAARYTFGTTTTGGEPHVHRWVQLALDPPVPAAVPPNRIAVLVHTRDQVGWLPIDRGFAGNSLASIRHAASLQPGNTEPFFAEGATRIDPEWYSARWGIRAFLEPLAAPGPGPAPGPMGHLLLARGLACREPGERLLATDALVAQLDRAALDPAALGSAMARLLAEDLAKASRWRTSLEEASRAGPRAASGVTAVLGHLLRGDPAALPRDFAKLLELLDELLAAGAAPPPDAAARAFLAEIPAAGQAGKRSRSILARLPGP